MSQEQTNQNEIPQVDLSQTLKASRARSRRTVSPWIQARLAQPQRITRANNKTTTPFSRASRSTVTLGNTSSLLHRVHRTIDRARIWKPALGGAASQTVQRFVALVTNRQRVIKPINRKPRVDRLAIGQEAATELVLPTGSTGSVASAQPQGQVIPRMTVQRDTFSLSAGQRIEPMRTPGLPPSPAPRPSGASSGRSSSGARPRSRAMSPKSRLYSRVEEVSASGTTSSRGTASPPAETSPPTPAPINLAVQRDNDSQGEPEKKPVPPPPEHKTVQPQPSISVGEGSAAKPQLTTESEAAVTPRVQRTAEPDIQVAAAPPAAPETRTPVLKAEPPAQLPEVAQASFSTPAGAEAASPVQAKPVRPESSQPDHIQAKPEPPPAATDPVQPRPPQPPTPNEVLSGASSGVEMPLKKISPDNPRRQAEAAAAANIAAEPPVQRSEAPLRPPQSGDPRPPSAPAASTGVEIGNVNPAADLPLRPPQVQRTESQPLPSAQIVPPDQPVDVRPVQPVEAAPPVAADLPLHSPQIRRTESQPPLPADVAPPVKPTTVPSLPDQSEQELLLRQAPQAAPSTSPPIETKPAASPVQPPQLQRQAQPPESGKSAQTTARLPSTPVEPPETDLPLRQASRPASQSSPPVSDALLEGAPLRSKETTSRAAVLAVARQVDAPIEDDGPIHLGAVDTRISRKALPLSRPLRPVRSPQSAVTVLRQPLLRHKALLPPSTLLTRAIPLLQRKQTRLSDPIARSAAMAMPLLQARSMAGISPAGQTTGKIPANQVQRLAISKPATLAQESGGAQQLTKPAAALPSLTLPTKPAANAAAIQRAIADVPRASVSEPAPVPAGPDVVSESEEAPAEAEVDIHELARQIYQIIRKMLVIERERRPDR